jgi:hypothetical protein
MSEKKTGMTTIERRALAAARTTEEAFRQIEQEERAKAEKTARLRALRLAREAQAPAPEPKRGARKTGA